jgi:hypothetical protein
VQLNNVPWASKAIVVASIAFSKSECFCRAFQDLRLQGELSSLALPC